MKQKHNHQHVAQFECEHCGERFEAVGEKAQWRDPIYGPMWQWVAECPVCQEEAMEYKPPMIAMKHADGSGEPTAAPSCPTGTCPFAN